MDNNKEAIRFIDRLYRDLYLSYEVLHHSTHNKTDKFNNLKEYFDMLSDMHNRVTTLEHRKEILKKLYHERYVIKPDDIPENYYELQKQIVLNSGKGYLIIDDKKKKEFQDEVIKNQEESLDRWLDYFLSEETNNYPFWVKYWAFQGMLKLGSFNRDYNIFNKRTKYTTAPFTELNKKSLDNSISLIIKALNKEIIDDQELKKLVNDSSFPKIYAYFFSKEKKNLYKNEGIWIKYDKGGDYKRLSESLNGYETNWCTKGEGTAIAQLSSGDFYIYYTIDENGEYKVPRIAIRMEGNNIAEIRGILQNQNVEPELKEVLEEKLKEFPDRDKYYKKIQHMEKLTEIYKKYQNNIELSIEELRFLYEIDEYIVGFGHEHDPRVYEIISKRDIYQDLSKIFNHDVKARDENYIKNVLNGNPLKSDDPLFPKIIVGYLLFSNDIDNMIFPDIVRGDIYLGGVESIKNTKFPKRINFGLRGIGSINIGMGQNNIVLENVTFPDEISGDLNVNANIMKNVIFPLIVHQNVQIKINEYHDIILPEEVGGSFKLDIKSSENITLPKKITKAITISSLGPTASNLRFPDVCWSIELPGVKYGTNLVLPRMLQDDLILRNLLRSDNMILPETIGGKLDLSSLIDGTNLVLPNTIGETLDIRSINYMEGIVLPKRINKDLHISIFALDYFGRDTLESIVGGKIFIYNELNVLVNKEDAIYK